MPRVYDVPGTVGKINFRLLSPVKLGSSANKQAFFIEASDSEFNDNWINGFASCGLSNVDIDMDFDRGIDSLSDFILSQRLSFFEAGMPLTEFCWNCWFPICEGPNGRVDGLLKLVKDGLDNGDVKSFRLVSILRWSKERILDGYIVDIFVVKMNSPLYACGFSTFEFLIWVWRVPERLFLAK